jgi:hypothetical protein
MDPYLEGSLWMSVHSQLASAFVRQLNPQILPRFIALPTRRFVRERPEGRTPVPHATVAIRNVEHHHLVVVIEILSPTNKRGEGYREYLRRRDRFLGSDVHLLEIDLLRKGRRVPMEEPLPPTPYFVFLSRAEQRPFTEVWPITLDQPLPEIPVPLLPGNPDAKLDLQPALATVYDECGLNYMIDYTKPPRIQLSPEQAAWADEYLRAAGLRP